MVGVINLLFSIRCRLPSIFETAALSNEEDRENTTELAMGKTKQAMIEAQLFEALRYKPECRGFDSLWCH
jgi:hypothetical protein